MKILFPQELFDSLSKKTQKELREVHHTYYAYGIYEHQHKSTSIELMSIYDIDKLSPIFELISNNRNKIKRVAELERMEKEYKKLKESIDTIKGVMSE